MIPSAKYLLVSATLVTLLGSSAVVTACGGTKENDRRVNAGQAALDPANFGDPATGANPWLPLKPGTQWVREGFTFAGDRKIPHQVTTTVTDVYREIDGIRTVAVLDYELDSGQISQESLDYLAEDKDGNLWNLGGYTEEFEGGRFVSSVDPWLSGVNGSKGGVLVQGNPKVGSPPYRIAQPAREDPDAAEVVEVGARRCVPFKCFDDVLIVREGKESALDNELKYYARHVGQIDNVPRPDSFHKDLEPLVNLTQLSPTGLAEASAEALRLDHHAMKTAPRVFGKFPPGKRG